MKLSSVLLPLAAFSLVSTAAQAADNPPADQAAQAVPAAKPEAAKEAYIPFANHGGVWDWRSEGDSVVYFQDSHRQWYKAELFSRATDLPFAQYIGIDAGPTGTLDKFGAIYVHGQKYPFKSFVKIDGPPPKKAKGKSKG